MLEERKIGDFVHDLLMIIFCFRSLDAAAAAAAAAVSLS